jgi:hypothetical protein
LIRAFLLRIKLIQYTSRFSGFAARIVDVEYSIDRPVSALALRTIDKGDGGMSFTALLVFPPEAEENTSIFRLFSDRGEDSTEFQLLNRSEKGVSGSLSLFEQDDNPPRIIRFIRRHVGRARIGK